VSGRAWIVRGLLVLALAAASLRLGLLAVRFARESVQADFSAFYTAGQAVRAGRSPYWNEPERVPPLWDGVSAHRPSRFLYPPLAASFFAPLSLLGYAAAKRLWIALSLAAVAAAMAVLARAVRLRARPEVVMALALFACLFQPLVLHLERGQVDALTLLAVALALRPMVADGRDTIRSGLLLAAGSVLKPSVAFLVPFLAVRRRGRALAGFAAGAALAVTATAVLHGTDGLAGYLERELPRISVEGEAHGDQMRLPPEVLARLRAGAPEHMTFRDGRLYRIESFRFVTNASLTRPLKRRLGLRAGPSRLALAVLAALLAVAAAVAWRRRDALAAGGPVAELAWAQAAMAAVLLAWPVTWAMNAVWLLPATLVLAAGWTRARSWPARAAMGAAGAGLVLAALPDAAAAAIVGPLASLKYVIAEALVFASMLLVAGARGAGPRHGAREGMLGGEREGRR
jgi:alpha-1,2-mannosyltransferase